MIERYASLSINVEDISKKLHKYENIMMKQFGMNSTHAMCMFQLGKCFEGLTVSELARRCSLDKAFISRIVVKLIYIDCVRYKNPAIGGYNKKLVLTEKGLEVSAKIDEIIESTIRKVSGEFTNEDINVFYRVLRGINRNLGKLTEK